MPIESPAHNFKSTAERSSIWKEHTRRVDPVPNARPTGWLCVENRVLPITEIELLEIAPGRGLHIRTRHDSWLISLPEELQSDELLRAITTGEVNCLLGSCEPLDLSSESSIWKEHTRRVDPVPNARPTGWLCVENRVLPITEIDPSKSSNSASNNANSSVLEFE